MSQASNAHVSQDMPRYVTVTCVCNTFCDYVMGLVCLKSGISALFCFLEYQGLFLPIKLTDLKVQARLSN